MKQQRMEVYSGGTLNKVFHKRKYNVNEFYLVDAVKGTIIPITNELIEKIFGKEERVR